MKQKLGLILLVLLLLTGCMQAVQTNPAPVQQAGFTEFTETPLPSPPVTATLTASLTSTNTPPPTSTPTSTITPTPECANTLRFVALAHLTSGIQLSYDTPYDLSLFLADGKLNLPNLKVYVNGVETLEYAAYLVGSNTNRLFVLGKWRVGDEIRIELWEQGRSCSPPVVITAPFWTATEKPQDHGSGGPRGGDGGGGDGGQ